MAYIRRTIALWLSVGVFISVTYINEALTEEKMLCSVDGCQVKIIEMHRTGPELTLTFASNFKPSMSGVHFHVWWGENFTVEQVSLNAQERFGVPVGKWDYTDDYPHHKTQTGSSLRQREAGHTLCVSAADGRHNIIDISKFHSINIAKLINENTETNR